MKVSLADQAGASPPGRAGSLAVALGANLGDPLATLLAVRPQLAALLQRATAEAAPEAEPPRLRWSPLFRTAPVGGPPGQPDYLNAVLLVELAAALAPEELLLELQAIEARHGRERRVRWEARSLDLDLLWCGTQRRDTVALTLPHPRLLERSFVLAPLAAIDPTLRLPGADGPVGARLALLLARPGEVPPQRLPGRPGWPD